MDKSPRILVVSTPQTFAGISEKLAFSTPELVESPDRAVSRLASSRVDCLLLDADMLGTRGLDRAIIDSYVSRGIPCITFSMTDCGDDRIRYIESGAEDHVLMDKVNDVILRRIVSSSVERNRLKVALMETTSSLRESEGRFRDIADRIEQGLWIRSADGGEVLYINPAFEEIWGRDLAQMNQQQWKETIHPDDQERAYRFFIDHRNSKEDYIQSYRIVRPNGDVRWIENHAYPVVDEAGNLLRMAGIARDITHQRQIEEELRLAQKLEGLGQLSAGIAHEINTPSQYVSDNISFLLEAAENLSKGLALLPALIQLARQAGAPAAELDELTRIYEGCDIEYLMEEMPSALEQSKDGIDQIKKIVKAMKGFSHPGEDMQPLDLNKAIADALVVARNEWKYVAEVETDLDENLPLVTCIPSSISQVILNIVINAAHAIGEVVKEGDKRMIKVSTRMDEGLAEIRIADTGPGMTPEIKARIFDPFYTTKDVGKGTGQGLAIARRVVHEVHQGTITVDTAPGEGTCFIIRLPVSTHPGPDPQAHDVPAPAPPPPDPERSGG